MFAAESILLEVQRRADMRNGEIIERIFREIQPECSPRRDDWLDEEISRMRQEQLLAQIHMQFCSDCCRSIDHCVCRLMPSVTTPIVDFTDRNRNVGTEMSETSTNNVSKTITGGGWNIYND